MGANTNSLWELGLYLKINRARGMNDQGTARQTGAREGSETGHAEESITARSPGRQG
jgi:hypothetical protein